MTLDAKLAKDLIVKGLRELPCEGGHMPEPCPAVAIIDDLKAGRLAVVRPMDAHGAVGEIYAWLGVNRDALSPEAVHRLQDIAAGVLVESAALRDELKEAEAFYEKVRKELSEMRPMVEALREVARSAKSALGCDGWHDCHGSAGCSKETMRKALASLEATGVAL